MLQSLQKKKTIQKENTKIIKSTSFTHQGINVKKDKNGEHIIIRSEFISFTLNNKKGMTIENLIFNKISSAPLITALPQGYYEDNNFNADFFSGHATIDIPGLKKITDLSLVKPVCKTFSLENLIYWTNN